MQAVLFASKGQKIITDASYKPSKQIAQQKIRAHIQIANVMVQKLFP